MNTLQWFGPSWGALVTKECPEVEAPVGETCIHCEEEIAEGDRGIIYAGNTGIAHLNCFLRGIFGSVAHIERRCSCFGGPVGDGDPEGMSKREAADLAVAAYYKAKRKVQ